jgi:uncharacterized protein (DUF342 family)
MLMGVCMMGEKKYKSSSLGECIKGACSELGIEENELQYEIIEEKKGIFKKSVSILVKTVDEHAEDLRKDNIIKNEETYSKKHGTIRIEDGKIIVKDPVEDGEPAILIPSSKVKLIVDGEEKETNTFITSENDVKTIIEEQPKAERSIKISISSNNMEAYITSIYTGKKKYKLKDMEESGNVTLSVKELDVEYPPVYTKTEIIDILKEKKIVYGILEDNIEKCLSIEGVENLLIAKGKEVINGTDDVLDFKFERNVVKPFSEDDKGTVDFKSIGFVASVEKGFILAIKKPGNDGEDGIDIYDNKVKRKMGKRIKINIGAGCVIQDENIVISEKNGKPSFLSNKFSVVDVHEISSDVNITTGNIKFRGDVVIHGDIKEGMLVESGNNVSVLRNMENSKINAKGNVTVLQNVIFSTILAGGEDVLKLEELDMYSSLNENIIKLIEAAKQVKNYKLLGEGISNGEIVKALIENKFNKIPNLCTNILRDNYNEENEFININKIIKEKLIGLGPLQIKDFNELSDLNSLLTESINGIKENLAVPVSVNIGYLQDTTVQSSGNVIISGKGQYVSKIIAKDYVRFLKPTSIARGGLIKANDEIKCGTIGSLGGVSTKIVVGEKGNIYAEIAYQNTVFNIGSREYVFEEPCKQIHAYLDKSGDMVVDKLLMHI